MSNQINVTISLHKEDRDRLDAIMFNQEKIIDLLRGKNATQSDAPEPVKEMAQEPENVQETAHQAPEPAPTPLPDIGDGSEVPEPHTEAAEHQPAPSCSREDVRNIVVRLCAAGKKPEVKEIVNSYADSVTHIPEDKLDECMSKLTALEG